jgi:hypothetical protein
MTFADVQFGAKLEAGQLTVDEILPVKTKDNVQTAQPIMTNT